jgi:hypothetical protein
MGAALNAGKLAVSSLNQRKGQVTMSAYDTQAERMRRDMEAWAEIARLKAELEAIRQFMAQLDARRCERESWEMTVNK